MKNPVLKDIETYAMNRLQAAYGYVGAAQNDELSMLNSSDSDGNDIVIEITVKASS